MNIYLKETPLHVNENESKLIVLTWIIEIDYFPIDVINIYV